MLHLRFWKNLNQSLMRIRLSFSLEVIHLTNDLPSLSSDAPSSPRKFKSFFLPIPGSLFLDLFACLTFSEKKSQPSTKSEVPDSSRSPKSRKNAPKIKQKKDEEKKEKQPKSGQREEREKKLPLKPKFDESSFGSSSSIMAESE